MIKIVLNTLLNTVPPNPRLSRIN